MTEIGAGQGVGNIEGHAFTLSNVTGATGSVVLTKTNAADDGLTFDCAAIIITGLTTNATDVVASVAATGTTWTTGGTGTTTAANEVVVAMQGGATNTAAATGVWQTSNTFLFVRLNRVGQSSGTCCLLDYAAVAVTSTGSYSGQTTGQANVDNDGFIATFK